MHAPLRALAAFLLAFLAIVPAVAAEPSPALRARAAELPALFNGTAEPASLFSPAFLTQVPPAQLNDISRQLVTGYGAARAVDRIEATSVNSATIFVDFERATVRLEIVVGAAPPNVIESLLIAGADMKADTIAAVFGELTALPGQVSIAAARLEESGPANFLTQRPEQAMAVGSAFKLFILAEMVRAVGAKERSWSDVVPLDRHAIVPGALKDWPKGSPVTLHTLAALMISRSDNGATDALLQTLGREKVERLLPALGVKMPDRSRPFLATSEMFALKTGDPARLARWEAADMTGRRAMLAGELAAIDPAAIDMTRFAGKPNKIATIEWFASAADIVRTLDWLRRRDDPVALDILAINPGLGRAAAEPFAYFGFKGGSEPGVLNLSFLLRNRQGRWVAVAATWNNEAALVDEAQFAALMGRLVALMR